MGASIRNVGEMRELAGCDLLTISPKLLEELKSTDDKLLRKLDPNKATSMNLEKISIDKATFDKIHKENQMAYDKLDEGIKGFTQALESLEEMLKTRLAHIEK